MSLFPDVLFASALGFPREVTGRFAPTADLDDDGRKTVLDYPVVTSSQTADAFATGQADALVPFE